MGDKGAFSPSGFGFVADAAGEALVDVAHLASSRGNLEEQRMYANSLFETLPRSRINYTEPCLLQQRSVFYSPLRIRARNDGA
jgi:hypothetical protein